MPLPIHSHTHLSTHDDATPPHAGATTKKPISSSLYTHEVANVRVKFGPRVYMSHNDPPPNKRIGSDPTHVKQAAANGISVRAQTRTFTDRHAHATHDRHLRAHSFIQRDNALS
eukprot:GHVU01073523.1.p1 GENE.GHVU01073523.1~~GHVU01073523.1.p1  ORF type:complete len:114 (+),score=10.22 GHVU01073523.1:393-734(+)